MPKDSNNRNRIVWLVVLGIVLCLSISAGYYLFHIQSIPVEKTMSAALINYEMDTIEHVHLHISGQLKRRKIGLIRFDGTLSIPEIEFRTPESCWIDFSVSRGGIIIRADDDSDIFTYGRCFPYKDDFWPLRIEWSIDPHNGNSESGWLLTAPLYDIPASSDSGGKPDMTETLDLRAALSYPITEVTVFAAGREIHISDSKAIDEAVDFICSFEFHLEENLEMDAPGAVSIIVRVFADSEMKELTFPYCFYNGSVYATDVECVRLFEDYFLKQQPGS